MCACHGEGIELPTGLSVGSGCNVECPVNVGIRVGASVGVRVAADEGVGRSVGGGNGAGVAETVVLAGSRDHSSRWDAQEINNTMAKAAASIAARTVSLSVNCIGRSYFELPYGQPDMQSHYR